MRLHPSRKNSLLERAWFILFATLAGSLIWIVQSSESRFSPIAHEASAAKEPKVSDKKHKCPNCSPPGNQEIYIPLIDLPESQGGEVVFNSRSPQAMSVTPVFYKRNGQTIVADSIEINSAEIRYVNIKDLLPERYRNERDWGGFALTYYGTNREMWSQFRFLGVNGGSNTDEFFTVKDESRSEAYEAAWWMPEKSEAIIALGNLSDAATSATVNFRNHSRTVNLQPHATELVREEQSSEGVASVKIDVNGPAGSIVPTGIITAKNGSFNSVIRFYDPTRAKQPNLYANGFRVRGVTPHMVLKNTTSGSLAVVPKFIPLAGSEDTITLPQLVLTANETKEVDLGILTRASQHRNDLDTVSVEVTNWAGPGSIIGSLYGTNNQTGIDYDTPLRDSGLVRTMTGSYPWKIDNDFTTIAYVTNISDQKAEFVGEINYQGGHVVLEPRKLAPHETAVFDLQKFRDNQTSDSTGNKLPLDVLIGQFKWSVKGVTNGKLLLIGRAEMVSRSQNISSSYSCNDPCPPYYSGDLNPFPPPIVLVSSTANSSSWETATYSSGYSYTWAQSADWSADSSALSLDPTAAHTTTLTGETTGSACITADMGREESYGWDGLNCYDNNNSYPVEDSGCADVVCAVPTNFRQAWGQDAGNGVIEFEYDWDSSTGNRSDLSQCTVGEIVTYPGSGSPYTWPKPPFDGSSQNPTIVNVEDATEGFFMDHHLGPAGGFVMPYRAESFTATQYYRYKCPCANNGNWVNLMGPLSIGRVVSQNANGTWKYTVSKSGTSAKIDPLP